MLRALPTSPTDTHTFGREMGEIRRRMLAITYNAANILRDYRQTYGYKSTPAILYHLATITGFILLRALETDQQASSSTLAESRHTSTTEGNILLRALETDQQASSSPLAESRHTTTTEGTSLAFEECLRCLMASGVQLVQPRGLARMLCGTAIQRNILVSSVAKEMLQIIAETAWGPSDLRRFDSCYPNHALTAEPNVSARDREMDHVLRGMESIQVGAA